MQTISPKIMLKNLIAIIFLVTICSNAISQRAGVANNPMTVNVDEYLSKIQLPEGFEISIYARDVNNARSLALSENNVLYAGSRRGGKVHAITDTNADFVADQVSVVAEGLNIPNGVALKNGDLYVAEVSRILKFSDIDNNFDKKPDYTVVTDKYPTEGHHGWKFIRFGPDGKLYVPVGAPCNTCEPDEEHAVITRINDDGSEKEVFAKGIRNTVGFDWEPNSQHLWFTDNGRDMLGDDTPPEELNRVTKAGEHFGFPYRYGNSVVDSDYKTDKKTEDFTKPQLEFPAHSAGLGMRFYSGDSFPSEYKNDIFIAYHGSWNRSKPQGYYIMGVDMENGEIKNQELFASGWLIEEKYWGRPVDLEIMADGSMLVSDDHANVVYRIQYTGK